MKVQTTFQFSNLSTIADMGRYLDQVLGDILSAINGNLLFDKNVSAKLFSVVFSQANTDAATTHALGRVPLGYIVTSSTVACRVYNGSTGNTSKVIYLRSDTPATVGILIF
jgi:hypothetical protein